MTTIDQIPGARRAVPADRRELTAVLSAAFLDDPVFAWILPGRTHRARVIEPTFDAFADAFARHDETRVATVAGSLAGVAMWAPPGVAPVHPDDEERFGARVAELAGPHLDRLAECMERFEAVHPEAPAWYLQFLAVHPTAQGQGLGGRLLRDVLDHADAAGESTYLEATSLRNRALYERHGFEVVGEIQLTDGPTVYPMWRDPSATPPRG
jgi:ribosomal protein S18 acetylase RimI-like enzyme